MWFYWTISSKYHFTFIYGLQRRQLLIWYKSGLGRAFSLFFGLKTPMASFWWTRTLLDHCLPSTGVQPPEAREELHPKRWFLSFLSLNGHLIGKLYIYKHISRLLFHWSIQYTCLIRCLYFSIFAFTQWMRRLLRLWVCKKAAVKYLRDSGTPVWEPPCPLDPVFS